MYSAVTKAHTLRRSDSWPHHKSFLPSSFQNLHFSSSCVSCGVSWIFHIPSTFFLSPALQMFCLLNPQTFVCEPNPMTTSSNFNVVGMSIEKLFDMWRNDEILKYYVTCAAVSALSWLSQFCTSKNRFRENSKFRHFVTYQITFLLTCQPHKYSFMKFTQNNHPTLLLGNWEYTPFNQSRYLSALGFWNVEFEKSSLMN